MSASIQKCSFCGKPVLRSSRRMNENERRGWKVFCSQRCLGLSRRNRREFICARKGCGKYFLRTPGDSAKSKAFYCSLRCAALVNNQLREKIIRICPNCKGKFNGDNKYCSPACIPRHESKYTEKVVIKIITEFFKKHGRIPVKRELYGCYKVVRKYFGTWNNAIIAAGFAPNPVMFAKKYIAKDGDKCDSLAEKVIDDYLSKQNIKHIRNFPYPGNKGFTVDFKVGDIWIEFFGLSGQLKRYDQLKRRKIKLSKELNLNLIKIYPKDVFPVSKLDNIILQLN
jgi:hypothetical protein